MSENAQRASTRRLVDFAQKGDQASRDELFLRHYPYVRGIVTRRARWLGIRADRYEDLIQDSVLSALGGLTSFEFRGDAAFRQWLAKIARNKVVGAARQRGLAEVGGDPKRWTISHETVSLIQNAPSLDPTPSQFLQGDEMSETIDQAIALLSERDQEAIDLRKFQCLDYSEIAEELEVSDDKAARVIVSRAMTRFSKEFERLTER